MLLHPSDHHRILPLSSSSQRAQDVERECAAACASLAMPMPLNVSLRAEDLSQLQRHLLQLLQQPEPLVPFTPSLKVRSPPLCSFKLFRDLLSHYLYSSGAVSCWSWVILASHPDGSYLMLILRHRQGGSLSCSLRSAQSVPLQESKSRNTAQLQAAKRYRQLMRKAALYTAGGTLIGLAMFGSYR